MTAHIFATLRRSQALIVNRARMHLADGNTEKALELLRYLERALEKEADDIDAPDTEAA